MLTVSIEPQIPTLLATSQSLSTDPLFPEEKSVAKQAWRNTLQNFGFFILFSRVTETRRKKHNSLKVPQTIGKQVPRNCSFWMHMKWFPSVTASVDIRVYSRCPPLRKRPSFLSQWLPLFVGWKGLRVIINVIMQDTTQAWLLEEMHIKM